jgi:hypothetical protein
MKKIIATTLLLTSLSASSMSTEEMLMIVGVVKYYNENCAGLSYRGIQQMNKSLKRFDMNKTPVYTLENTPMANSGYNIAKKFGCINTKNEAEKAGFRGYLN